MQAGGARGNGDQRQEGRKPRSAQADGCSWKSPRPCPAVSLLPLCTLLACSCTVTPWLPAHRLATTPHDPTPPTPQHTAQDSLTQPLRLGVGLGVSSANADDPFLTATASKHISLLEGEHTQLTAKARLELDPRSSKVVVGVLGVGWCWAGRGAAAGSTGAKGGLNWLRCVWLQVPVWHAGWQAAVASSMSLKGLLAFDET